MLALQIIIALVAVAILATLALHDHFHRHG